MKSHHVAWLALGSAAGLFALVRRRSGSRSPDTEPHEVAIGDVEALGRVIASEAGERFATLAEQRAIAWTTRNRAHKRGVSIARLVCAPSCGPCCKGRPFSSRQPATEATRALAAAVLAAPPSDDPTGGALAFFEPKLQDQLVAQGHPGYRRTAAALRQKWRAEGQVPRGQVGRFEFWK